LVQLKGSDPGLASNWARYLTYIRKQALEGPPEDEKEEGIPSESRHPFSFDGEMSPAIQREGTVDFAGYLMYREAPAEWEKQFFVLFRRSISRYASPLDPEPIESFNFGAQLVLKLWKADERPNISIEIVNSDAIWSLWAPTARDFSLWFSALLNCQLANKVDDPPFSRFLRTSKLFLPEDLLENKEDNKAKELDLSERPLSEQSLETLVTILNQSRRELRLKATRADINSASVDSIFHAIAHNPYRSITRLDLSHNKLGGNVCAFSWVVCSSLTHVIMRDCRLDDTGLEMMAQSMQEHTILLKDSSLQHLDISHNRLTGRGLVALLSLLSPHTDDKLETLNLSANRIGEKGIMAIVGLLGGHRALRHLHLSNNLVSDKGINALAAVLSKNPILKTLDLSSNPWISRKAALAMVKIEKQCPEMNILMPQPKELVDETPSTPPPRPGPGRVGFSETTKSIAPPDDYFVSDDEDEEEEEPRNYADAEDLVVVDDDDDDEVVGDVIEEKREQPVDEQKYSPPAGGVTLESGEATKGKEQQDERKALLKLEPELPGMDREKESPMIPDDGQVASPLMELPDEKKHEDNLETMDEEGSMRVGVGIEEEVAEGESPKMSPKAGDGIDGGNEGKIDHGEGGDGDMDGDGANDDNSGPEEKGDAESGEPVDTADGE